MNDWLFGLAIILPGVLGLACFIGMVLWVESEYMPWWTNGFSVDGLITLLWGMPFIPVLNALWLLVVGHWLIMSIYHRNRAFS